MVPQRFLPTAASRGSPIAALARQNNRMRYRLPLSTRPPESSFVNVNGRETPALLTLF
jgi:hypothetical protein